MQFITVGYRHIARDFKGGEGRGAHPVADPIICGIRVKLHDTIKLHDMSFSLLAARNLKRKLRSR